MATNPSISNPPGTGSTSPVRYAVGQRLRCKNCGAEIEITSPCPCNPPDMVLQCCGQEMTAETGSVAS